MYFPDYQSFIYAFANGAPIMAIRWDREKKNQFYMGFMLVQHHIHANVCVDIRMTMQITHQILCCRNFFLCDAESGRDGSSPGQYSCERMATHARMHVNEKKCVYKW